MKKAELESLSEDRLRIGVLIPLFKSLGYADVCDTHGGPLERGRDITMVETDKLGNRVGVGVVIKAKRITGKVSGVNSASEVRTQIEQCLSTKAIDSCTANDLIVSKCIVVSSKEIKKEALHALKGILSSNKLDRATSFIDGAKLLELVNKHLPAASLASSLADLEGVIKAMRNDYSVQVIANENSTTLIIDPKCLVGEPLFSVNFNFPQTPEGMKARRSLEEHWATGKGVRIEKQFINGLRFHDTLADALGVLEQGIEHLELSPATRSISLLCDLVVEGKTRACIQGLHFDELCLGLEQLSITNSRQKSPWRFVLSINRRENMAHFDFSFNYENVNVREELDGLQFHHALAQGGHFSINNKATGLSVFEADVPENFVALPDQRWMDLVKMVASIQEKTKVPLSMPRNIAPSELHNLVSVREKIMQGKIRIKQIAASMRIDKKTAGNILRVFQENKKIPLRIECTETADIIGQRIDIGKVIMAFDTCSPTANEVKRLQEFVEGAVEGSVSFKIVGESGTAYYLNWLTEEDKKEALDDKGFRLRIRPHQGDPDATHCS